MNVSKVNRNSAAINRKMRLNDYANKYDKSIVKNNLTRIQIPQNNQVNQNINNNLYQKSNLNIIKNNKLGSLTFIKSLPSHIIKKQFYITPSKLESNNNLNKITPDLKTEKNEDSLSTFPLTKESMIITPQKHNENIEEIKNNQRSLSCAHRSLNKNGNNKEGIIFVKKKIQGSH